MPAPKPVEMSYLKLRGRWMEIAQLPYGKATAARQALAAELGITEAALYHKARKAGWPTRSDVPKQEKAS